jgi:plastocyanin
MWGNVSWEDVLSLFCAVLVVTAPVTASVSLTAQPAAAQGNSPPTSSVESPSQDVTITAGDTIDFTVHAEDPDGNLHGTSWYVDGSHQGNTYDLEGSSSSDTWSYTFDDPGTYTIEADVFDLEGAYNSEAATWTVTVESENSPPTASRDAPEREVTIQPGDSVDFRINADDQDGNLQGTEWYVDGEFDDETQAISGPGDTATWSRTFDSTGTYTVEGQVFDDDRAYSSPVDWRITVEDENSPPTASRDAPEREVTIQPGDSVDFRVDADDQDGNLQGTEWYVDGEFDDETQAISGSSDTATWSRTFDAEGTYTVESQVFDDERAYSSSVDWQITVEDENVAPTASRDAPQREVTIQLGDSVEFRVNADDQDGNLQGTEWYVDGEFDDETQAISGAGDTATWSRTFDSAGTYTVEAQVFDDERGYSSPVDWRITVEDENSPPTASRDAPEREVTIQPGESIDFRINADDGDGNLQGTEWYVDDKFVDETRSISGSSDIATWSRTFESEGTYIIEGITFDGERAYSSPVEWQITVEGENSPPTASRESPDSEVTLQTGDSIDFRIDAEDLDGNLEGTEWYVDGALAEETQSISGSSAVATWSRTFDAAGTYVIEGVVFDGEREYSSSVEWTITVEGENTAPTASRRDPQREVTIQAGESVDFGISADDEDGNLRGTEWYVDGTLAEETQSISGSSDSVTWSRTFDSAGTYTVEAQVFDGERVYSSPVEWTITVEGENTAPTASRQEPQREVAIQTRESITFRIEADDPDGNLLGTEWYVDGDLAEETQSISGSSDTVTWSRTFDSAGTYIVEAQVFDDQRAYTSTVEWIVTVEERSFDIEIVDLSVNPGIYRPSETATATVEIENRGTSEGQMFVGYSAIGPNGRIYDNDGRAGQTVQIGPGERQTVTVEWQLPEDIPSGSYDASVVLWKETSPDELETRLDTAQVKNAFDIRTTVTTTEIPTSTEVTTSTETTTTERPKPETGSLVVTAAEDSRRSLSGASVSVSGFGETTTQTANEGGEVRFQELRAGRYTVSVEADGTTKTYNIEVVGSQTKSLPVELPGGSVQFDGTVVTQLDKNGVEGLRVEVGERSATTDSDGVFRFDEPFTPDKYSVRVYEDETLIHKDEVSLEGDSISKTFTLLFTQEQLREGAKKYTVAYLDRKHDQVGGIVYGEFGVENPDSALLTGINTKSLDYYASWLTSSIVPVLDAPMDIRDCAVWTESDALSSVDCAGATVSVGTSLTFWTGAGLAGDILEDVSDVITVSVSFLKHAPSKVDEVAKVIWRVVPTSIIDGVLTKLSDFGSDTATKLDQSLPNAGKVPTSSFSEAGFTRSQIDELDGLKATKQRYALDLVTEYGFTPDQVMKILRSNTQLKAAIGATKAGFDPGQVIRLIDEGRSVPEAIKIVETHGADTSTVMDMATDKTIVSSFARVNEGLDALDVYHTSKLGDGSKPPRDLAEALTARKVANAQSARYAEKPQDIDDSGRYVVTNINRRNQEFDAVLIVDGQVQKVYESKHTTSVSNVPGKKSKMAREMREVARSDSGWAKYFDTDASASDVEVVAPADAKVAERSTGSVENLDLRKSQIDSLFGTLKKYGFASEA